MYFGQIKQGKIVFLLFWIKKSFLHQKKKLLKKSKNSKFSKRVSPWFLSKNRTFCHVCLLGKSSQKRSFFGILDKKECFLDQKKEVLKNDKKSTFSTVFVKELNFLSSVFFGQIKTENIVLVFWIKKNVL